MNSLSWQEECRQAFRTTDDLQKFLQKSLPKISYPLFIPPSLAIRIRRKGPFHPLWKQFIPHKDEEILNKGLIDPIGDQIFHKAPQIIHRYTDRCLFMPTPVCPIICRFCFRKNELFPVNDLFVGKFEKTLSYLHTHTEIEEIIFSGGDPLMLSDKKIEQYLYEFGKIQHIKYIRFHTRFPTIIPQRISSSFIDILNHFKKRYDRIHIVIHINHSSELEEYKCREMIKVLGSDSIEILSQTTLLRDLNDSPIILRELIQSLIELRIRPYYLHHPDLVKGAEHFMISKKEGRSIYRELRRITPGWALPQYVIECINGGGKRYV